MLGWVHGAHMFSQVQIELYRMFSSYSYILAYYNLYNLQENLM